MLGIDPRIMVHGHNMDFSHRPVKQKCHPLNSERSVLIVEEVNKLLRAEYVKEIIYPDCLSNVVLVKKIQTSKWLMCVDFTNLNKRCSNDSLHLPKIDQLVDTTVGHKLLTLMDAYLGYNQLDQQHTTFITYQRLYCYKVMLFGLKNARMTYQRMFNKMFAKKLGCNMEVYVDDMLVKSKKATLHLANLEEAFGVLRHYGMKLNPTKCAFGVPSGNFIGFMVNERGIEANPEKI